MRNSKQNTPFILEENKPLSQSLLWKLQRDFFENQGIEAWRLGTVPHYVTSNAFIADAYAQVVFGYLRDCQADPIPLDQSQPVYIVELGSGPGRFAFHFLKRFQGLFTNSILRDIKVKYVMTDFARKTIGYWEAHPWLKPLVEQGLLDFAHFDTHCDRELILNHSGETLCPNTVKNPIVVLANYFFDSIPQDVFHIRDGQLHETRIAITSSQPEMDLTDPDLLNRIDVTYNDRSTNSDYYDNGHCNDILHAYQQRLEDTFLLFPCDAIRCINSLEDLSGGRLMLLTADKGYSHEEDLLHRREPGINVHGSFSMMVNYHALGQYVLKQGGQVLHPNHHHNSLNISAFVLGQSDDGTVETKQSFYAAIEKFSPDDFFTLKKGIEKVYDTMTLPQILSCLRLSGWDANTLHDCFPTLLNMVDSASEQERHDLYCAIQQVWDTYYPIGEKRDLPFDLGILLYGMGNYAEALEYFKYSLWLYGPDASTAYNMAMCYYCLGQMRVALKWIRQTLALNPSFEGVAEMQNKIQAQISPSPDNHERSAIHTSGLTVPASST